MKRNMFEELKDGLHALEKQREGKIKLKRLEAVGWKVGSTSEFLNLSQEEMALVDQRLQQKKDSKPSC